MEKEKFIYSPTASSGETEETNALEQSVQEKYPCPCCGCLTLPVPSEDALAYVCPVCFWENDVFIVTDEEPSDENHGMTLWEARSNYREFGACCERMLCYVRKPYPQELPKQEDSSSSRSTAAASADALRRL